MPSPYIPAEPAPPSPRRDPGRRRAEWVAATMEPYGSQWAVALGAGGVLLAMVVAAYGSNVNECRHWLPSGYTSQGACLRQQGDSFVQWGGLAMFLLNMVLVAGAGSSVALSHAGRRRRLRLEHGARVLEMERLYKEGRLVSREYEPLRDRWRRLFEGRADPDRWLNGSQFLVRFGVAALATAAVAGAAFMALSASNSDRIQGLLAWNLAFPLFVLQSSLGCAGLLLGRSEPRKARKAFEEWVQATLRMEGESARSADLRKATVERELQRAREMQARLVR